MAQALRQQIQLTSQLRRVAFQKAKSGQQNNRVKHLAQVKVTALAETFRPPCCSAKSGRRLGNGPANHIQLAPLVLNDVSEYEMTPTEV